MQRQTCNGATDGWTHFSAATIKTIVGTLFTVIALWAFALTPSQAKAKATATNMLYVATNDPRFGMNAILAYHRRADGTLVLPPASYPTGGTGVGNPGQIIGPNDADHDLIANPDHTLMFAVNPGSDTIAVFNINADGSLTPVNGSPFPSGGVNPVSLALTGDQLYVVNKSQDPTRSTSALPNYTGFRVAGNGHLSAIPHSTVELEAGSSPTEALLSPGGDLMFGMELFPGILDGIPPPSNCCTAARASTILAVIDAGPCSG